MQNAECMQISVELHDLRLKGKFKELFMGPLPCNTNLVT